MHDFHQNAFSDIYNFLKGTYEFLPVTWILLHRFSWTLVRGVYIQSGVGQLWVYIQSGVGQLWVYIQSGVGQLWVYVQSGVGQLWVYIQSGVGQLWVYIQSGVGQLWVLWKSVPWNLYLSCRRTWVSFRTSHFYCPVWAKFGVIELNAVLLSVCLCVDLRVTYTMTAYGILKAKNTLGK